MSQFFQGVTEGSLPPSVATSYTTDNGTAVPSGHILDIRGIDVTENNDNGIKIEGGLVETGASNRVQVQLTNRIQGSGSTVGATTTDLITFSLGSTPGTFKFHFELCSFESTTPAGAGYSIEASARTTGLLATIISTPDGDEDEDDAMINADWDIVASGNNLILRVLGVAGLTINWGVVGYYVKVI